MTALRAGRRAANPRQVERLAQGHKEKKMPSLNYNLAPLRAEAGLQHAQSG